MFTYINEVYYKEGAVAPAETVITEYCVQCTQGPLLVPAGISGRDKRVLEIRSS